MGAPKFTRRRAQKEFPTNFAAAFWWLMAVNVSLGKLAAAE